MSDQLERDIKRGIEAELLWQNAIFTEAREGVRNAIIKKWAASPIRDREGQHELRLMLKLLDDLEGNIQTVMRDGKMAEHNLKTKQSLAERAKRGLRNWV